MLKVSFKVTHPDMDYATILRELPKAYEGSDYEVRMRKNMADGILLYRTTANVDGEYVHYTMWKDRESNEAWTNEIYATPSLKRFYDNLASMGFTFTVTKEDV